MQRPEAGAHHQGFETQAPFLAHKYSHTNVTHKRNIGVPMQFVRLFKVNTPCGEQRHLLEGTQ
eukprot:13247963-Heterocapsa_arctica.AAC.1